MKEKDEETSCRLEDKFANHKSDKRLVIRIYKEPSKLSRKKKQAIQLENGKKTCINTSPKRVYKWPRKKSTSLTIR